jgi:isopentenyl diphosphate isomerase/L-lactate dehydrogenase-like FMN-dependent dehydrogenase
MRDDGLISRVTVLQEEIETCLKLLGVKTIDELGPQFVS